MYCILFEIEFAGNTEYVITAGVVALPVSLLSLQAPQCVCASAGAVCASRVSPQTSQGGRQDESHH